jgi:hypothetical protein
MSLFTFIRIRILLHINVMRIYGHWTTVQTLYGYILWFEINADPDPTCYSKANPDPVSQTIREVTKSPSTTDLYLHKC